MPSAATLRLGERRRRQLAQANSLNAETPPPRGWPVLRVFFVALMLTSGAVFFFNGTQMVVRQSRVSAEREKEVETCLGTLEEVRASCDAKMELAGREQQRMTLQQRTANASCAVVRAALDSCRREGDKCLADLGGLSATNADLQRQGQRDEEKAAKCERGQTKLNADLAQCTKQLGKLSGAGTSVGPGNEDLLQMEHQELVDEIQRLRVAVKKDAAELKAEIQGLDESLATARASEQEAKQRLQAQLEQTRELNLNMSELAESARQLEEDKARLAEKAAALEAQVQALEEKNQQLKDGAEAAGAGAPPASPCQATADEMKQYLNYTAGGACPDDWPLVQLLVHRRGCLSLPRRKCRAPMPEEPPEPLPRPESLFSQGALRNESVRWAGHQCPSFACLNARRTGECLRCFNLTLEAKRWQGPYRGSIPMADVVALKNGTLRIGVDVGGGTGSFAAHMAGHGIQVVTTGMDGEMLKGELRGVPFLEAVALRGLMPLSWPAQARLPFLDGALDVVHSSNSVKHLALADLEEQLYDWDRVLRPGGLWWFETFTTTAQKMPKIVSAVEAFGYKKHHWQFFPRKWKKTAEKSDLVTLNCVLEKTVQLSADESKSEE